MTMSDSKLIIESKPQATDGAVKVRVDTLDVPMPSDDPKALLGAAIQNVAQGPLGVPKPALIISPATMALWVETRNALRARDARIAELERRIEALEAGVNVSGVLS